MALTAIYTRLKHIIQALNLFEDIEKNQQEDLKNQRISTWVLLILLFLSSNSLLIYASLTYVTKTVVVQQPKITFYKELQSKYPNTLVCPCQQILNEYSTFIRSFTGKFNQICSSDFVSDQWLNYVNYRSLPQMQYQYIFEFRHSAYSFFQMLRTLCTLVSQTINDQLIEFYSTTLLTESLISEETFLATALASKDHFLNTTRSSFQTSLNSLRTIIQADTIVNRLGTNYATAILEGEQEPFAELAPFSYPSDGCTCDTSSYCNTTTGIYSVVPNERPSHQDPDFYYMPTLRFFTIHLLFDIPGINVGCFILDTVLQSDLSCLYNSSCLLQLNTYLNDSLYPFNATALNISYSPLPTVNNLVDKLMVDEWIFNASYESYFSQCNPLTCTYTYDTRFDILFIITTVMGSIGGFITILMLVTLPLVTFTRRFICRRWQSPVNQTEIVDLDARNSRSLLQHLESLPSKIKNFVVTLNLFKDPENQTVHDLKNQHISTYVFIISKIITLGILVLYTSLTIITQTVTIKQPTVNVYTELQTKYSQTLTCPCTNISIDYEEFISFHPTFHQICSSDFITTQWMNYLRLGNRQAPISLDLRAMGPSYFSTLFAFCNLSVETINDGLLTFNSTTYVTKNVQHTDLFRSQAEQIVNLFKQTTTNSFLQTLSMGQRMIYGNALFSAKLTNFAYTIVENSPDLVFYPVSYYPDYNITSNISCSCKFDPSTCGEPTGIGTLSNPPMLLFVVPGLWNGCYTIESLFGSTFECYFNQSCLNTIYELTSSTSFSPFNATAMIYNASSTQYNITTKLQIIIEQVMIEQWNEQISFSLYYEQCNPEFCVYTYNTQGNLAYMFTTIIALIGGLTTVLRILIPPFVAFLRRKQRPQPIQTEIHEHEHEQAPSSIRKCIEILRREVVMLNLFKNPNNRTNEQVRYQRISTRLFIILFTVSFFILLTYTALENVTQTITIKNPSIDQFNLLYQQYSDKLRCPCKTLSIQYQNFIQFGPQFHTICDSDFITSKTWLEIDYPSWKYDDYGVPTFHPNIDDYRQIATLFFQMLSSFCQLSMQTLNKELLKFNFTIFITPNLVSQQQFHIQTSQIIDKFIINTAHSFISTIHLVNNMTVANMLISALSSDSILTAYPQYSYVHYDYISEYVYDRRDQLYNSNLTGMNCDCQENPFCIQQVVVYDIDATTILFPVPGIYVGCYIVQALLQSDLRCFYENFCLQELMNSLNLTSNTSSLSNLASIYQDTTSLQEIISHLMIEQWNSQTRYEDYFNRCQPDECSATFVDQRNVPYIITTMIGLIGGLSKIYLFAVPLMVQISFFLVIRLKRRRIFNIRVAPLETMPREANTSV